MSFWYFHFFQSFAKKPSASFKISFAFFNSVFSRSSSEIRNLISSSVSLGFNDSSFMVSSLAGNYIIQNTLLFRCFFSLRFYQIVSMLLLWILYCTFSFLNTSSFNFILSIFWVSVDSAFMISVQTNENQFEKE